MELTIFSKLIKGIYRNQQEELTEYFEITNENEKLFSDKRIFIKCYTKK
ncbi:MAG: hypothetical protein R2837_10780 [Aliarcobacter sp.]